MNHVVSQMSGAMKESATPNFPTIQRAPPRTRSTHGLTNPESRVRLGWAKRCTVIQFPETMSRCSRARTGA
jgi:hypothetical protein